MNLPLVGAVQLKGVILGIVLALFVWPWINAMFARASAGKAVA